ncbi:hypothetical protein AB5I41_27090 [Sphingomonas sp. MMS24-JH45]
MFKELGLVNSYAGVILPSLAGVFAILFVRQAALASGRDARRRADRRRERGAHLREDRAPAAVP